MAPIKFEEHLKDKLEKRSLSPSAEGWSKLSERLDADQKKSRNLIYWWLSIAAGLIIMIAVSVQFFNNEGSEEIIQQVVEEVQREFQKEKETQNINIKETTELAIEDESNEHLKDDAPIINKPRIIEYKKVTEKRPKSMIQIAENNKSTIKTAIPNKEDLLKEDLSVNSGKLIIEDAVATAIKQLKSDDNSVTDREIDSLLKVASKELFKNKLQKESSKTVDADALLLSVQEDMGQSFRTKVFEALKESYETVKTKVAERNN
ncbi:hypothetical protein [Winogradskyella sp. PG-2]|uniref:hypothetical protein n=1 Tax=Winogradskyella sp. PG-2 TaxID=754409 RepID=UPI0004588188|nr:hypothetical protein [Winogradskyella sp. PG-2]BAO74932.1 hypothetical protein WPG_0702 [Winogradskyella sp. PG-2]